MSRRPRVLYLDAYTVARPDGRRVSSDAIGYGISASGAIRRGLRDLGYDVALPPPDPAGRGPADADAAAGGGEDRLEWILSCYRGTLAALRDPPDAVFSFHVFAAFPTEVRRMALDLGLSVPMLGYTHGSHWDPSDSYRFEVYPGMELLDLANLDVLDRVLVVSRYMRTTLRTSVAALNEDVARRLDAKVAVVGLPLDVERIDACRPQRPAGRPTIVYNHAPVSSKNPDLFAEVMHRVLPRYDVGVLFTRRFAPGRAGCESVGRLAADFPGQVVLGNDLSLDDYYRALWDSELQVSTASHESLGMATLEAMYTGTCCVLPRLGSYPEVCDDHPDVLYELGADQLEERLCFLLDHPQRRREIGAQLRRLTERYHPGPVVAGIGRTLAEVLGERAAPARP
jgi:glycosyltransferase involved in cell wall biosynthesis